MGVTKKLRAPFWESLYNRDHSILGSILRPLFLETSTYGLLGSGFGDMPGM